MSDSVHAPRRLPAPDRDATVRAIAGRQHGVVARRQLLDAGVPGYTITHRLRRGELHALHRGVYRVGPAPLPLEREMAAVLASGDTAVLSHRSAAAAWALLPDRGTGDPVDVSIQHGNRSPGPSVRVHRVGPLADDERTTHRGIPTTMPCRTLVDLAGLVRPRDLEQALAEAERTGLVGMGDVERHLARRPRRRGAPVLRALLARTTAPAFTRSEAESLLLELLRKGDLPEPETNVRVRGVEVDLLWRKERLIVEVDGFAFHASSRAFERDRRRDARLTAAGYRVVRITWRQLVDEREAVLVRVALALASTPGG